MKSKETGKIEKSKVANKKKVGKREKIPEICLTWNYFFSVIILVYSFFHCTSLRFVHKQLFTNNKIHCDTSQWSNDQKCHNYYGRNFGGTPFMDGGRGGRWDLRGGRGHRGCGLFALSHFWGFSSHDGVRSTTKNSWSENLHLTVMVS